MIVVTHERQQEIDAGRYIEAIYPDRVTFTADDALIRRYGVDRDALLELALQIGQTVVLAGNWPLEEADDLIIWLWERGALAVSHGEYDQ